MKEGVFTTGEVARICNVAPRTVSKWFDSGRLKGYRIPGSNDRRFPAAHLFRFMRENHIPIPAGLAPPGEGRALLAGPPVPGLADAARAAGVDVEEAGDAGVAGFSVGRGGVGRALVNTAMGTPEAVSLIALLRREGVPVAAVLPEGAGDAEWNAAASAGAWAVFHRHEGAAALAALKGEGTP